MRTTTRLTLPSLAEEKFFLGLDPSISARLDTFAWHRRYDPRQIIYFPDDRCDYVYWVRSGRVKITHVTERHRELTYRHLFKGDLFGEEGLADRSQRKDYAEALTDTVLTLVRYDDFFQVVQEEGTLSLALARHCCRRALDVEKSLSDLLFMEVRQRIACRLLELSGQEAEREDNGPLRLTHQELANLVGATRETVTVTLRALQEEGIVTLGNRHLYLVDPERLAQVAQPL
ncbi:MAG TPA: Crp/Fnr family transcriptional regulator [Candidatus Hydrogenedentes bacterium]|jgi:CRP-like cAMP-binding protein|nr:MAG: Cyclic AMP receptor-like protein [Candidatus Hydrogenedentes bacterium ADurb.Bin170]HNZ48945.1 Crp/Fnr family transcriptional regulator [Candidatus Hydrogenedentota bacterium]HOD96322.1 Crp/Fnr family transcriptional regulator [Candidatus Hydrogenedentota bacterium]HOR51748.1 Crp/Fnr family transcriptional regulator [Candidatus Hydrogenedentota bacterium]HPK25841.1 Crp/Fnr family transcriptional regulator [Candidatus Hydrogenedentota bacterium]